MDYDETVNLTSFNSKDEIPSSESRDHLIQEIIIVIFVFIEVWANMAIIFTILRYTRMRSVPNILVTNWAIADLLSCIVTPSAYRILSVLRHFSLPHEFVCLLEDYGSILHSTVLLFVIVLTIDWFIAAYFGGASDKFRSNYKLIIGSVWLFAIIFANISSMLCMNNGFTFMHPVLLTGLCYIAILLIVIVCQISRGIQKCRRQSVEYPTLMLTLPTVFILTSFLSFIAIFVHHVVKTNVFGTISICLLYSNAVANLILLYFFDKDFHCCFLQTIRRSGAKYEEGIPDLDNPVENTEDDDYTPSVKITFHNNHSNHNTEELLENEF